MSRTIAIIGAMPQELAALRAALADAVEETQFGKTFYRGQLDGRPAVLTLSGIGKVNAAAAAALTIALYQPSFVLNTGSAGGLGEGIAVGDVVLGAQTAHHDADVRAFGYAVGQIPQLPARFEADEALTAAAEAAVAVFEGAAVHRGLIVSGDQFVDSAAKTAKIRHDFPDVLACEMEAAAIAQVCYQFGVPFAVVRAISDHADEKADVSFEEFIEKAGMQSAAMVRRIAAMVNV